MSRSYHATGKTFRHCSKAEINEMAEDSNSQLYEWAEKKHVKKVVKRKRKDKKIQG